MRERGGEGGRADRLRERVVGGQTGGGGGGFANVK